MTFYDFRFLYCGQPGIVIYHRSRRSKPAKSIQPAIVTWSDSSSSNEGNHFLGLNLIIKTIELT